MNLKTILVIAAHAFVGWALCGATVSIGRELTSMESTLIIHAVAAPLFFAVITALYYRKFAYTTPLTTALLFTGFVIVMDAGLVAPVFEGSYEMFTNALGTWIPFALIFVSTYRTGLFLKSPGSARAASRTKGGATE